MKVNLHPFLPELKNKVLRVAHIEHIVAADCYQLAQKISAKTHKTISLTTIKRIYGFAQTRFATSNFTLNVLSQYCGYDSWLNFVEEMEAKNQRLTEHLNWNTIAKAAHEVTHFTLQTNKLTCGIPYAKTIQRQSIHEHLITFLKTDATACVLSAPSGMGKTIGITKWVDQQLASCQKKKNKSIFLYVNSFSLTFAARFGFHIGHWFANLLNLPHHQQFEDFITQYKEQAPGNFFLIVDDFNNNLINKRLFEILFKQLVEITTHLSNYNWMKVLISIRPATWQKYGHLIENHEAISNMWFTNFPPFKRSNAVNLSPFTLTEIQQLFNNFGHTNALATTVPENHLSLIKTPVLLQYYYQLKGGASDFNTIDPADIFPTLSLYLRNHVLKGARAAEKQAFLTQLVKQSLFEDQLVYLNKKEVLPIIKENSSLYSDLLHTGILYEYQWERGNKTTYQIRFQSAHAAMYFLAQDIIDQHQGKVDKKLLARLTDYYVPERIKQILLHWLLIFTLESADQDIFFKNQNIDRTTAQQLVQ